MGTMDRLLESVRDTFDLFITIGENLLFFVVGIAGSTLLIFLVVLVILNTIKKFLEFLLKCVNKE